MQEYLQTPKNEMNEKRLVMRSEKIVCGNIMLFM